MPTKYLKIKMEKNTKTKTVLMVTLLLFSIKSSFSKIMFTIYIFVIGEHILHIGETGLVGPRGKLVQGYFF